MKKWLTAASAMHRNGIVFPVSTCLFMNWKGRRLLPSISPRLPVDLSKNGKLKETLDMLRNEGHLKEKKFPSCRCKAGGTRKVEFFFCLLLKDFHALWWAAELLKHCPMKWARTLISSLRFLWIFFNRISSFIELLDEIFDKRVRSWIYRGYILKNISQVKAYCDLRFLKVHSLFPLIRS